MNFIDLARSYGLPKNDRFKNAVAVVKAIEDYVDENDPTFQVNLSASLSGYISRLYSLSRNRFPLAYERLNQLFFSSDDYFSEESLAKTRIRKITIRDALKELYGPFDSYTAKNLKDNVCDRGGGKVAKMLLYIDKAKMQEFLRTRVNSGEIKIFRSVK